MATSDDEATFLQQIAAMIKTAQDAEHQAAAACTRVKATEAVLEKERATAAALEEQAVNAAKQMTSPQYTGASSPPVLEPSSDYEAAIVANLHVQAAVVRGGNGL
jgi:ABC-type branched-subunit amino acid transport system substrate-binding protein